MESEDNYFTGKIIIDNS